MRYLLLFFISISAYGQQVLKAGVYRNLKPTAPIVLDTGSFTFTGLVFKSPIGGFRGPGFSGLNGKEVLLDASKAREITLLNCIFQGEDQKGIALQSAIEKTTVIQCRFSGLRVGILANQKQAGKGKEMVSILSVTSNTFQNLRYGVWLQAGTHTLSDFRCNQFVHTLTGVNNAGVGLYIGGNLLGQAVPALGGVIGDNGLPGNEKPNGNVWPVAPQPFSSTPWPVPPGNTLTPDQLLAGWVSPTNWTSIRNDNTNPANGSTKIGFVLEQNSTQSFLEIFDIATGKIQKHIGITVGKEGTLEVGLHTLPSGIYGCRLVSDGAMVDLKRLSIVH